MPDIRLTLTPEETNLVLAALGEVPFKISAGLIGKIKAQGDAQMQAAQSQDSTADEPIELE